MVFDIPRHKLWFNFEHDWPRINYLPEYFTVHPEKKYRVTLGSGETGVLTGEALRRGLRVELEAGKELFITIEPIR